MFVVYVNFIDILTAQLLKLWHDWWLFIFIWL